MADELPVWVCGQQLWVRGVDMKTTCNDIIHALVGHNKGGYVIIERWRGVEKPLSGLVKVLQLWSEWGDAQDEVKLTLRKVSETESGRGSPASVRRRRHHKSKAQSQTVHPKKLSQLAKTQSIENLLKVILAQGETIQNQLKKLQDKEAQIGQIEDEKNKTRISDPALESYLNKNIENEDEKENDSGIVTEGAPSENTSPIVGSEKQSLERAKENTRSEQTELKKSIELWEKIVKINKKLEKEEEALVRLYITLHRSLGTDETAILAELKRVKSESDSYARELKCNNYIISKADLLLTERRKYLHRLYLELEANDMETARLMQVSQSIAKSKYKNMDSNSDTGLSSLHSSSEEGTYVLEELL